MMIKIEELINKDWIIQDIGNDHVRISYNVKKGNNPKPFVFPRGIRINEFLSECIAMYLGDGKLSKDLHHSDFTNKDIDLICKMLRFFKYLGVNENDMTFTIDYRSGNENEIVDNISKLIGTHKFRINKTDRNKYPSVHVQVNGKIFRIILERIIMKSLKIIKNTPLLRRAWLRGYFSAEGCVGYHSKENYLGHISFSYNPQKESWLRDYCISILNKEGIRDKIRIRHEEHNGSIIITNWNNYYRLWKIGIFNGCERKRKKFEEIIKRVKITCDMETVFRKNILSNINQYELATLLGTYQATISNIINKTDRNMWLTKNQIMTLCERKNISIDDAKKSVIKIRFGNLTEMKMDKELIEDIFNL